MLAGKNRIPRKMFFLFSAGKTAVFGNSSFLLKIIPSEENQSRFCFSVSKKIAKKAVWRNKMRRTGYRLLGKYLPQINKNILAIFYFKEVMDNDKKVEEKLKDILIKSKLIKKQ